MHTIQLIVFVMAIYKPTHAYKHMCNCIAQQISKNNPKKESILKCMGM